PGRAGDAVRPRLAGRPPRPPGRLDRPLQVPRPRFRRLPGPERAAGREAVEAEHAVFEEASRRGSDRRAIVAALALVPKRTCFCLTLRLLSQAGDVQGADAGGGTGLLLRESEEGTMRRRSIGVLAVFLGALLCA